MEALVLKRSNDVSRHHKLKGWFCMVLRTITGHAGLARNTSRDEDNLSVSESFLQSGRSRFIASNGAVGIDVAEIGSDTCRQNQSIDSDEWRRPRRNGRCTYQGHRGYRKEQAG